MGMISEFKAFAMKGNLIDIAVGFVMGSAFATVTKDFIDGVFMPALQPVMGGIDLSEWKLVLEAPTIAADGTVVDNTGWVIDFGLFLTSLITFIIVAFVMFLLIKGINKAKKKEEAAPSAPPADQVLLAEIRDLLARQNSKL